MKEKEYRHARYLSDHAFRWEKKQILRYSTPATAKTAVAGDPGTLRMTLMKCSKLREVFWGELVS